MLPGRASSRTVSAVMPRAPPVRQDDAGRQRRGRALLARAGIGDGAKDGPDAARIADLGPAADELELGEQIVGDARQGPRRIDVDRTHAQGRALLAHRLEQADRAALQAQTRRGRRRRGRTRRRARSRRARAAPAASLSTQSRTMRNSDFSPTRQLLAQVDQRRIAKQPARPHGREVDDAGERPGRSGELLRGPGGEERFARRVHRAWPVPRCSRERRGARRRVRPGRCRRR